MSEQQLGRPLRHVEQKALVWMHDYNNIGSDIILTVLLYCKSIDKSSVSYAESIITSWWNDGIQTLPQVTDAINEMEHRRSFTGHIQKAFEMHPQAHAQAAGIHRPVAGPEDTAGSHHLCL